GRRAVSCTGSPPLALSALSLHDALPIFGMLATVMNCIYVSDIFRYVGMKTEVFTPFVCGSFTSLFSKDAAVEALEAGKVIFFAGDRKSTRLNSSHVSISYAVFCLKKKKE